MDWLAGGRFVYEEHPRARGENSLPKSLACCLTGTSPRTRGKPCLLLGRAFGIRNIPAHAGKTAVRYISPPRAEEHPRARGENVCRTDSAAGPAGTSPRTRGKHFATAYCTCPRRNIPAHAGKTTAAPATRRGTAEHPRARGENTLMTPAKLMQCGTSPRTRGKPTNGANQVSIGRNIPAHAGKTR